MNLTHTRAHHGNRRHKKRKIGLIATGISLFGSRATAPVEAWSNKLTPHSNFPIKTSFRILPPKDYSHTPSFSRNVDSFSGTERRHLFRQPTISVNQDVSFTTDLEWIKGIEKARSASFEMEFPITKEIFKTMFSFVYPEKVNLERLFLQSLMHPSKSAKVILNINTKKGKILKRKSHISFRGISSPWLFNIKKLFIDRKGRLRLDSPIRKDDVTKLMLGIETIPGTVRELVNILQQTNQFPIDKENNLTEMEKDLAPLLGPVYESHGSLKMEFDQNLQHTFASGMTLHPETLYANIGLTAKDAPSSQNQNTSTQKYISAKLHIKEAKGDLHVKQRSIKHKKQQDPSSGLPISSIHPAQKISSIEWLKRIQNGTFKLNIPLKTSNIEKKFKLGPFRTLHLDKNTSIQIKVSIENGNVLFKNDSIFLDPAPRLFRGPRIPIPKIKNQKILLSQGPLSFNLCEDIFGQQTIPRSHEEFSKWLHSIVPVNSEKPFPPSLESTFEKGSKFVKIDLITFEASDLHFKNGPLQIDSIGDFHLGPNQLDVQFDHLHMTHKGPEVDGNIKLRCLLGPCILKLPEDHTLSLEKSIIQLSTKIDSSNRGERISFQGKLIAEMADRPRTETLAIQNKLTYLKDGKISIDLGDIVAHQDGHYEIRDSSLQLSKKADHLKRSKP